MSNNFKWYIVNVYSGYENKVSQAIWENAKKSNMEDKFEDILVPSEPMVQIKKGVKKESEQCIFPGYILVKMILSDATWQLVRGIPRVAGFLGGKSNPTPVSEDEVIKIKSQMDTALHIRNSKLFFQVGEQVKVCDGPFNSFMGLIEEVDDEKERIKVTVSFFGRSTPVELAFNQVEKIQ